MSYFCNFFSSLFFASKTLSLGFCRVPKSEPDRAYPYVCPAGFGTIGYGHLFVAKHLPITMDEGETYLAADMAVALSAKLPTVRSWPPNRRDDLRQSLTSHSTLASVGCVHRRFDDGSISATV